MIYRIIASCQKVEVVKGALEIKKKLKLELGYVGCIGCVYSRRKTDVLG